ncbi:unnamed protein product, partial [Pocillopora meandrina]
VKTRPVGFKAEAVDEEGVWCACIVEEVDNDYVIISSDGWNAEWNCRILNDVSALRRLTLLLNITQTYVKQKAKITVRFNF